MKADRSIGLAALAFSVLTFVGLIVANPPGGSFSAKDLSDYAAKGHRPAVYVALNLLLVAAGSLLYLVTRLSARVAAEGSSRIFSPLGFTAGAAWAIGASLLGIVPVGLANGGHLPADNAVVYLLTQLGFIVLFAADGITLGAALLAFAIGGRALIPGWLRWVTVVAGVLGLASPAFFPFFALLLWGIVFGVWALASRGGPAAL
jgi:hypothetical protein